MRAWFWKIYHVPSPFFLPLSVLCMSPNPIWLISLQEEIGTYKRRQQGGHSKEAAIWKPRKEVSEETNPNDTFILNFYPLELWENYIVLSHPLCGICYGSPGKLVKHISDKAFYNFFGSTGVWTQGLTTWATFSVLERDFIQ
jgi:hypothetical protein